MPNKENVHNTSSFGSLTPSLIKSCFCDNYTKGVKDKAVRLIEAYFRVGEPWPRKKKIFDEAGIRLNSVNTRHFLSHFKVDDIPCVTFEEWFTFLRKIEVKDQVAFLKLIDPLYTPGAARESALKNKKRDINLSKQSSSNLGSNKKAGDFAKLTPSLEISCFSGSNKVKNNALLLIQAYFNLRKQGNRFPSTQELYDEAGCDDIYSTYFLNHFKVGNIQCHTFQDWFIFLDKIKEEEQQDFIKLIKHSPSKNKNSASFGAFKPSLDQRFFWGSKKAKDQAVQLMVNYFKLRNEGNTEPTVDELFPDSTSNKNSIKIETLLRGFEVNGTQCRNLRRLYHFLNKIKPTEETLYIQWVESAYTSSLTSTEEVQSPSAITLPNSTATEANYNVGLYSSELVDLFSTMEQPPKQNQFPSLFPVYGDAFLPSVAFYPEIESNTEPSQENGKNSLSSTSETKKRRPTWGEEDGQPAAKKIFHSNKEAYFRISEKPAEAKSHAQPTNAQNNTTQSQQYSHAQSRFNLFAKKALPRSRQVDPNNNSSILSMMSQFPYK